MKTLTKIIAALATTAVIAGCSTDADVVSHNLSKAADQFQIERRIVFYNGITGDYMLSLEGRCSIENLGNRVGVTCKTGNKEYKKHYLGLSDNVTYFAEQIREVEASAYHYKVIFKPETIIPNIDLETSVNQ